MIKDEISKLIDGYKKSFYEQTGIVLVCYPDTALPIMPIETLKKLTEEHFGVKDMTVLNRHPEAVIPRRMLIKVATDMGYGSSEIGRCLKRDPQTIMHANRDMTSYMEKYGMKVVYAKYMEYMEYLKSKQ